MIRDLVDARDDEPLLFNPDDKTSIYKYFTYTNFLKLICSKSLYFSRISSWEDCCEGIIPQDVFYKIIESLVRDYHLPDGQKNFPNDYELYKKIHRILTDYSYACCFHINDKESPYMWDSFAKGKCEIAIKTSIGKIRTSLQQPLEKGFVIGSVFYDLPSEEKYQFFLEDNYRLFYKNDNYREESEFRILLSSPSSKDKILDLYSNYTKPHPEYPDFKKIDLSEGKKAGIDSKKGEKIAVDLEYLIDEVILRPNVDSDLEPIVRSLINRNIKNPSGINIKYSDLK